MLSRYSDLCDLREQIERVFAADTAVNGFWDPDRPSIGHCAAVAAIVRDRFDGDFVSALVHGASHWFNRLNYGGSIVDVDITGDQFGYSKIRMSMAGLLHTGTRVRKPSELNEETLQRARLLAKRAGLSRSL